MRPGHQWSAAAVLGALLAACKPQPVPPDKEPEVDPVREVTALSAEIDSLPFAEVIEASTGRKMLPLEQGSPFLDMLPGIFDAVLDEMNAEGSPVRALRRINEASRFFEDAIALRIDALPEFRCSYPKNAAGKVQRSGYPDLVVHHEPSGAVAYLDPKLFEEGGRSSSLRTFYYEPKGETGKVLLDAHHLLVGISHDGNDGAWRFTAWDLVDLSKFKVRLKAEFQGSNRDLYREETIIMSRQKPSAP